MDDPFGWLAAQTLLLISRCPISYKKGVLRYLKESHHCHSYHRMITGYPLQLGVDVSDGVEFAGQICGRTSLSSDEEKVV